MNLSVDEWTFDVTLLIPKGWQERMKGKKSRRNDCFHVAGFLFREGDLMFSVLKFKYTLFFTAAYYSQKVYNSFSYQSYIFIQHINRELLKIKTVHITLVVYPLSFMVNIWMNMMLSNKL